MTRVLIAGVSVRGFAESAARAGYEVVAIDGFGDLDLRACAAEVRVVRARMSRRFSARAAAAAARDIGCDAVVYESSFENHPAAVRALAAGRVLWGNPPAVLARARDPRRLTHALQDAGLAGPAVRFTRPATGNGAWMLKRVRSGGGDGVTVWRRGAAVPRGSYLQRRIAGVAGSIVFAADGQAAVPLGVSRILAGEGRFGADGFRYCGNILAPAGDPQFPNDTRLVEQATRIAQVVTRTFGLAGVNGVDFIARERGVPYAIEVNPRYTAAMELVEQAYGESVFKIHAQACQGDLPAFDLAAARSRAAETVGKAVLYARHTTTLGDSRRWLADHTVRDISPAGTRFALRDPICTIFARGRDARTCLAALRQRAAAMYDALERREPRIA